MHQRFSQYGGAINFTNCGTPMGSGGGLQVRTGSLTAYAGTMSFAKCKAAGSGGGAQVGRNVRIETDAMVEFEKCKAGRDGGGRGTEMSLAT